MCGRYVITSPPDALLAHFGYADTPDFPARYNVAPTQPIPIVRLEDGRRRFALVRWGLVPAWVKDPAGFSLLINARGETAADKPAFRNAVRRRRCLVPADGFYEWRRAGGRAQPWLVRLKGGGPLAFAGLWETWTGPNGEEIDSAAIVTCPASPSIAHIHDRMPVILPPEAYDLWLDGERVDRELVRALLVPLPDRLLEAYPVSTAVNRTANDSPVLIAPAPAADPGPAVPARRKAAGDGGQGSLF